MRNLEEVKPPEPPKPEPSAEATVVITSAGSAQAFRNRDAGGYARFEGNQIRREKIAVLRVIEGKADLPNTRCHLF